MANNRLHSDARKLVREAEQDGWTVTRTSKNHLRFERAGVIIIESGTPGDRRSLRLTQQRMRRATELREQTWTCGRHPQCARKPCASSMAHAGTCGCAS